MNSELLKYYISKNNDTQEDIATALGINLSRLNAKINEIGHAEFWQSEILFFKTRYNLTPKEVIAIFFNKKVA